jgi:hypothetical protein
MLKPILLTALLLVLAGCAEFKKLASSVMPAGSSHPSQRRRPQAMNHYKNLCAKSFIRRLLTALFLICGFNETANATAILDQSFLPGYLSNYGVRDIDWQGQSFTAGQTGLLSQIDYGMWRTEELNLAPVELKILSLDADGLVLSESDSLLIDVSTIPSWQAGSCTSIDPGDASCFTKMNLRSLGINVILGASYAFILTSDRYNSDWSHLDVAAGNGSLLYDGGNPWAYNSSDEGPFVGRTWGYRNDFDVAFQTFVDVAPVPVPGTLALLGAGLLGWVGVKRSRRGGVLSGSLCG